MSRSFTISGATSGRRCSALSRSTSSAPPVETRGQGGREVDPRALLDPEACASDGTSCVRPAAERAAPTRRRRGRVRGLARGVEREPRLPGPARPGEREQPDVLRARRRRPRPARARGRGTTSRAQGDSCGTGCGAVRSRSAPSWKTRSGADEVLEPVLAEVDERRKAVGARLDQGRRRCGDDDLAAVPRCRDARRPMDVRPDVALAPRETACRCGRRPGR